MSNAGRIVVYPGSFDPFTLGHLNIVERVSRLFEQVIVGVGINWDKTPWFSVDERVQLIKESTAHLPNIRVETYEGLTVRFVQQCGANIMVRGVRPITDIPAELTMMMANRRLAPNVETLFLIADGELAHVSSSLIRDICSVADQSVFQSFLPQPVIEAVLKKSGTAPQS